MRFGERIFAECLADGCVRNSLLRQIKNILINVISLKINELIQSSQAGVYFFSIQLLLKEPVVELNDRFVFHRTYVVDVIDT